MTRINLTINHLL